jgi:hypothetical protein
MVALKLGGRKAGRLVDLKVARHEVAFLDQFRRKQSTESHLRHLCNATGVSNELTLKQMRDHGVHSGNHVALKYAPVAEVAWASGRVTSAEYVLAMKPMFSVELIKSPEAVTLFGEWLTVRPPASLWTLWEDYIREARGAKHSTGLWACGCRVYDLAEQVALASGGVFDQGKICPAERLVLDRIISVYGLDRDLVGRSHSITGPGSEPTGQCRCA